ncbi:slipin family protein [Aliikangiella sp. G2MR2-5]|uniref:slipin family protein n=1 Tax=Aliikangiella sp. G2MR2-5 TaxID=2788943 RepID=UPI0018AA3E55|nr:slipin family protein [Aliikangiella sp. G2MR2-5]
MFGLRKTLVLAENQKAYLMRNKQFERVLAQGKHSIWDLKNEVTFEIFDISTMYYTEKFAKTRVSQFPQIAELLHDWTIANDEVGLFYMNEQLMGIVVPGERVFVWKDAGEARLERINIKDNVDVTSELVTEINRRNANTATSLIKTARTKAVVPVAEVLVSSDQIGLLYLDGKLERMLEPGKYGFWRLLQEVEVKLYETKTQANEISGQEILTKDRVSLRINLTAHTRLVDVRQAAEKVVDVYDYIYKTMQLALREAVGTRTLDELLVDKLYINETVRELVEADLTEVGVKLERVGVKDIILPGEMKAILNQVVEAQKAAEANVIKRREETAATRSLHNTAKMMENNPTLMRLKELESLEKIAEKVDSIKVYGGLNGLMNNTLSFNELDV